jgi:hypothetical protein
MIIKHLIPLLLLLLLAGCSAQGAGDDKLRDQINVFGATLFSSVDYREINGVKAIEEPCIKGYERSFDALDIIIGYGFDKSIRKIMTRNVNTSLFGIKPGMPFGEGRQKLLNSGFTELEPPFKFRKDNYSLAFLVDRNQNIFGLTTEALD